MFLYEQCLRLKITCIASGFPQMFPWVRVALRDRYNCREFSFKNHAYLPNTQWASDYSLIFLVSIVISIAYITTLLFIFYNRWNYYDYFFYFSKPNVRVNLLVISPPTSVCKPPMYSWKPRKRNNRQCAKRPPVKIEPVVRFSCLSFYLFSDSGYFFGFIFLLFKQCFFTSNVYDWR